MITITPTEARRLAAAFTSFDVDTQLDLVRHQPASVVYEFSGPRQNTPAKGAAVQGRIYIPDCMPGGKPIADYTFKGTYLGECADGFMVRPTWRSDGSADTGTIFCRNLTSVEAVAA